jgi:hypothetical protein
MNNSIWQQISNEEEMHFYHSVNDVISAMQYHGLPAIMEEIAKNATLRQQLHGYLTKIIRTDILEVQ